MIFLVIQADIFPNVPLWIQATLYMAVSVAAIIIGYITFRKYHPKVKIWHHENPLVGCKRSFYFSFIHKGESPIEISSLYYYYWNGLTMMRLINLSEKSKKSITLSPQKQQDSLMHEFEWYGEEATKIIGVEAMATNGRSFYSPRMMIFAKLLTKLQRSKVRVKTLKRKINKWINH